MMQWGEVHARKGLALRSELPNQDGRSLRRRERFCSRFRANMRNFTHFLWKAEHLECIA